MMQRQKLNWIFMLLLVPILILGLTACGGRSESEASPATTAEEKAAEEVEAEAPAQTEETTAAGEPAAEAPAQSEETTTTEEPEEAIEIREATTVMAATQVIDLNDLPLPDEAKLMGQPEAGSLRYQAPIDVAEAVELYRSALTDQGWQEDTEGGHVDKASASLFFTKEDFNLSLSAGDMGEGKTMVTLINLGNIDLRALPQMADVEDVYYFPSTLGYFSPTDVAGVADFTRRELAAQGWHEYTRPNTAMADDPEQQSFTLIQNGLELSVSVGVAPAQGGKTAVQYSVSLLPLDLPVPVDAAGLELEKMLLNLSLSYTTPADFETLFDYYSREMTDLGWVVIDSIGMMTPERGTLFFGNENVPPHTLVLDLIPSDGQTLATLRDYEADELTELNAPGASSQTEETPTEIEEPQVGDSAGEEIPTHLILADAQDVSYSAGINKITYQSPSDIETVLEFYRRLLSGWQENTSTMSETLVSIEFKHGEEFLFVDIADSTSDGLSYVNVAAHGAPSIVENTGIAISVGEETTTGSAPDDSVATIPAFLTPVDAQDVVYDADLAEITYTSPSDVETVIEFYRQSLPDEGWQEDEVFATVDETFASVMFNQGADSFNINIFSMDITEVTVDMSFAPSLAEIIEGGSSTGTETAPGDSGPLSLVEEEGFPVPSDYEYLSTMESPFAIIVTFGSPSDVDTLVDLYETELLGQGWEVTEHSLDGDVARLYFENGEQKLSIDLRVNDGEISPDLAGQTSVELTVKDPAAAAEAEILPPPGQARIMLMNAAEVNLMATINQQEFELIPIPMSTEFPKDPPSIDLPPGQYTLTTGTPDGSVVNEDFEVGLDKEIAPDEVWAFILDADGMPPMQWPVY